MSQTRVSPSGRTLKRVVVDLLIRMFDRGVPDVLVISPFRNVANRLKELVPEQLASRVDVADDWRAERFGTIHTFQGSKPRSFCWC